MLSTADNGLSEGPVVDYKDDFDVVIHRGEAARHELSAALSVLGDFDFPVLLAQRRELAILAKLGLCGAGRIRYAERPEAQTGDRNRPAVHLAKFGFCVMQLGNGPLPVGYRDFPAVAVDEYGAGTERSVDPRPKDDSVLRRTRTCA